MRNRELMIFCAIGLEVSSLPRNGTVHFIFDGSNVINSRRE